MMSRLRAALADRLRGPRRRHIAHTYVDPAAALVAGGQAEAADALLDEGLARHPDDADLLVARARAAFRSGRAQLAIARWEAALAAAPARPECLVGLSGVLRVAGHLPRAGEIIARAARLLPDDPMVIAEVARIAEARGDFTAALAQWRRLTARRRPQPIWRAAEAQALMMLGRLDEAEAVLRIAEGEVRERRAEEDLQARQVLVLRGRMLAARRDWPAAVAFWTAFQRRFPNSQQAWQHLGRAVENLAFQHTEARPRDAQVPLEAMASIEVVADAAAHALLMEFDAMGAGCEFGLVQRRYGAEPLSLLRWNAAPMSALLAAFENGLEGLGEPGNTVLFRSANGEYFIRDRRWGLAMHTWLFAGQVDEAQLYERMCRRLGFLREKLLADLGRAEKVFLHHAEVIEAEAFARLHALLRAHGPVSLLGVQPAYRRAQPGEVVQVGEDRFIGFVGRLGRREDGSWDILFEDWLAVCRNAKALIAASRGRAPEAADVDFA